MIKKVWLTVFFFILVGTQIGLHPVRAHAQTTTNKSIPYWGPILSCEGSQEQVDKAKQAGATEITKVCTNLCDLFATAQNGLFFLLTIIAFVLIPLMLVVGGLMVILGGAYPKWVATGKGMTYGAVGGAALALSSFLIINTILYVLSVKIDDSGTGKSGIVWGNIQCHIAPAKSLQYDTPTGGNGSDGTTCDGSVCGGPNNCSGPNGCGAGKSCALNQADQKYSCQASNCDSDKKCGGTCYAQTCTAPEVCQKKSDGTYACALSITGNAGEACATGPTPCKAGLTCGASGKCLLPETCFDQKDCQGNTICALYKDNASSHNNIPGACRTKCQGNVPSTCPSGEWCTTGNTPNNFCWPSCSNSGLTGGACPNGFVCTILTGFNYCTK